MIEYAVHALAAAHMSWMLLAAGLTLGTAPDATRRRLHWLDTSRVPSRVERVVSWSTRLLPRGASRSTTAEADSLRLAASWELLAACLRTGMPLPAAIRAIAATAPPRVESVLSRTSELLALGADHDAAWQGARQCPETAELARAACRTARSGTALAAVAVESARRARAEVRDRARARAQRAGVLMTGPLGLCFLPAFLCLGVIPVVLGLASQLGMPW